VLRRAILSQNACRETRGILKYTLLTNQPTNQPTMWSRVLPEKLTQHFLILSRYSPILSNQTVHRRVHNNPPPVPVLSQINPVHALPFYYFRKYVNIISHLCLDLPSGPFLAGFLIQNPIFISVIPHTCYVPSPSHS
jgi:hypothetical protein